LKNCALSKGTPQEAEDGTSELLDMVSGLCALFMIRPCALVDCQFDGRAYGEGIVKKFDDGEQYVCRSNAWVKK
jgi:hypothetical protein